MRTHRIRPYILFLSLIVAGIFVLIMTTMGYYPIVLVGNSPITAHEFWKHYDASLAARRNQENTFQVLQSTSTVSAAERATTTASESLLEKDLQAMVLDSLIEDAIVHKELQLRLGSDLGPLVEKKVAKAAADPDFRRASAFVFGMPFSQMKDIIFVPQAERDILTGKLYLANEGSFDSWVQSARKAAKVTILSPKYSWEGGKVVAKD